MSQPRYIDIDDKVVMARFNERERYSRFQDRANHLYYELHVAETVPQRAIDQTNHGNTLS